MIQGFEDSTSAFAIVCLAAELSIGMYGMSFRFEFVLFYLLFGDVARDEVANGKHPGLQGRCFMSVDSRDVTLNFCHGYDLQLPIFCVGF